MSDVVSSRRSGTDSPSARRITKFFTVCVSIIIRVHGAERRPRRSSGEIGHELVGLTSRLRRATPSWEGDVTPEVTVDEDFVFAVGDFSDGEGRNNERRGCCCKSSKKKES